MILSIFRCYFNSFSFLVLFFFVAVLSLPAQELQNQDQFIDQLRLTILKNRAVGRGMLDSLYSLKLDPNGIFMAKIRNCHGIYHAVGGNVDSASLLFNQIIADTSGDKKTRASAYFNLGVVKKNNNEPELALELLEYSRLIYIELGNIRKVAVCYGEIASIYNSMGMYNISVDFLLKAISTLEQSDTTQDEVTPVENEKQKLANTYMLLGNFNYACVLYEQIIPFYKKTGNKFNYSQSLLNYGNVLKQLGRLKDARRVIDESIALFKEFEHREYLALALSYQAEILVLEGQSNQVIVPIFQESIDLLSQSTSLISQTVHEKFIAYLVKQKMFHVAIIMVQQSEALQLYTHARLSLQTQYQRLKAEIYTGLNMDESISQWRLASEFQDSLLKNDRQVTARELQIRYINEGMEKELALKKTSSEKMAKTVSVQRLYLAVLLLFLLLVGGFAYQNKLRERVKRLQLEQLETEQRAKEVELKLKSATIKQQQQELVAVTLENISQKGKLSQLIDNYKGAKNQEMKSIISSLNEKDERWEHFLKQIATLYPDFLQELHRKYPKLTQSDLEFCAMVRLNMSFKDIAKLLNISHQSVITKKYRVAQKLKVNGEEDFFQIIHGIV